MKRLFLTIPMIIVISACASTESGLRTDSGSPSGDRAPQALHLNFDVIDVNNNDRISRDEFVAARMPLPSGESGPDKDEIFNRIDRDNSDAITRSELDEYRLRPY